MPISRVWITHGNTIRWVIDAEWVGGIHVKHFGITHSRYTAFLLVPREHGRVEEGLGDFDDLDEAKEVVSTWAARLQELRDMQLKLK